jgi:hypothetical protein
MFGLRVDYLSERFAACLGEVFTRPKPASNSEIGFIPINFV